MLRVLKFWISLKNTISGNKFNGFDVIPVAVHCGSEEIVLGEKEVKRNTFDDLSQVNKFYDSKLSLDRLQKINPTVSKDAKMIHRHMDKRQHSIYFRKCLPTLGENPCGHCKDHPARSSSNLIKDLPEREKGGLFYSVIPDPKNPGHNKTFLQLILEKHEIVPDGDL